MIKYIHASFLVVLLGSAQLRASTPILDQHFSDIPAYGGDGAALGKWGPYPQAQSFTVGIAGQLSTIGLILSNDTDAVNVDPVTVEIVRSPGGIPDPSQVLATRFVSPNILPTYSLQQPPSNITLIDFSADQIPVAIGDQLGILLTAPSTADYITAEATDTYDGGNSYTLLPTGPDRSHMDSFGRPTYYAMVFQTYVTVPEPAAFSFLALALLPSLRRLPRR